MDGTTLQSATLSSPAEPQARLRLAWSVIFAQSAVPLIYYGDEMGIPGYGDPDNRQPLWWTTGEQGSELDSIEAMAERLEPDAAQTLQHVAALSRIRKEHPALWRGESTEWWVSEEVWASARVDPLTGDEALVLINRSSAEQTVENGLSFAGLTATSPFVDALSDDSFTPSGDSLQVTLEAWSSRVLVHP